MQKRKDIVRQNNKVFRVRLHQKENVVFQTTFAHSLMNNKYEFKKRNKKHCVRLHPLNPRNKMNVAYL